MTISVEVRDSNVSKSMMQLKRTLIREGLFKELKKRKFYTKPSVAKRLKVWCRRKAASQGLEARTPGRDQSGFLREKTRSNLVFDQSFHFYLIRETPLLFLRKNQYTVDIDVEITPATFDQAGFSVECFLKLGRQTGCTGFVVSLDAIFYTDFHRSFLCND